MIDSSNVGRGPTGWGTDQATECLSLNMGLLQPNSLQSLLLNTYPTPKNLEYNPCQGLKDWAYKNSKQIEWGTYARYWFGHSVVTTWLTYLFGLGFTRNLLFCFLLIGYFLLIRSISFNMAQCGISTRKAYLVSTSSLLIYFFSAGILDLASSIPHLLSELLIVLTGIALNYYFFKLNNLKFFTLAFGCGGLYVVIVYAINPQSIFVTPLCWVLNPLIFNLKNIKLFIKKIFLAVSGLILGFLVLWSSKLIIIKALTNFPIGTEFVNQFKHRASQDISQLSTGVSNHLNFIQELPSFIQAILANIFAYSVKFWDPRFSSSYFGLIIIVIIFFVYLLFLFLFKFIKKIRHYDLITILKLLTFFSPILFILFWYGFLAQHSFDHSTYTFRSLALVISSVIYLAAFNFKKYN